MKSSSFREAAIFWGPPPTEREHVSGRQISTSGRGYVKQRPKPAGFGSSNRSTQTYSIIINSYTDRYAFCCKRSYEPIQSTGSAYSHQYFLKYEIHILSYINRPWLFLSHAISSLTATYFQSSSDALILLQFLPYIRYTRPESSLQCVYYQFRDNYRCQHCN